MNEVGLFDSETPFLPTELLSPFLKREVSNLDEGMFSHFTVTTQSFASLWTMNNIVSKVYDLFLAMSPRLIFGMRLIF